VTCDPIHSDVARLPAGFFFERDVMAIKKLPKRATATRNPPLAHRRNKLIQRSVGLLVNESEDALGMVLQDRTATPARLRYTHVFAHVQRDDGGSVFMSERWVAVWAGPGRPAR
jgi:hypothetical protein